jgi:hypothetical protein
VQSGQATPQPIVVRVLDEPVKSTGVSDIVVGALGLTGVMLIAALLLGACWARS